MKFYSFFIFIILFINLVGASDPTFQINKEFDLKRVCSFKGFNCEESFICNLTLSKPDGTLILNNSQMTNSVSYRNMTINSTQNNQLGFHKAIMECNNGTNAGMDTFDIVITADGKEYKSFPNQFFIILLGVIFVILGVLVDRLRLFKYLGSALFMVFGVLTLYPGYNFINWGTLMGKTLGFILIGLGFYFLLEDSFSRSGQSEHPDQNFDD